MPRTKPLTNDELAWASITLRSAHDLASFNRALIEVYVTLFEVERTYFYHFYDGRLNAPLDYMYGFPGNEEELVAFLRDTRVYDPADVRERGRLVHHSSEVYRLYHERPDMTRWAYESFFSRWGFDWMLSVHLWDDNSFLACAGMSQRFDLGDFTSEDFQALEALHPHIEAAFKACCAAERTTRFGAGMAKAIEHHPSALFVFNDDFEPLYVNALGRRLLQHENAGESRLPMTQNSTLVKGLRSHFRGEPAELPGVKSFKTMQLAGWPELGLECIHVVMANPQPSGERKLTARQDAILRVTSDCELPEAAAHLGITVATLRTHLRNIYRRLGVSGLNEAVAMAYLT